MSKKNGLREQVRNWSYWSALTLAFCPGAVHKMFEFDSTTLWLVAELEDSRPKQAHPFDARGHQPASNNQYR